MKIHKDLDSGPKRMKSDAEIKKLASENKDSALTHVAQLENRNALKDVSLYEKLRNLIELGFDQVKLIGGTSKDKLFYSGIIPYEFDGQKSFSILVVPYNSTVHLNESSDYSSKKDGETSEDVAVRELYEEGGLIVKHHHLESAGFMKKEGSTHTKFVYAVNKENWTNEPLKLDGSENPIDRETGEPFLIEGTDLCEVLWPGHHWMLKKFGESKALDKKYLDAVYPFLHLKGFQK
jgi:ADP-ribose pyrophosphatase YjhB (NUDIX family)